MIRQYEKNSTQKLSEHFSVPEFACHCDYSTCNIVYVDFVLVENLEKLRADIKLPIHINSGFRCVAHNRDIGGKKGSYHLLGKAADIKVNDFSLDDLYEHCSFFDGLGIYPHQGFVHCDVRGYRARWTG